MNGSLRISQSSQQTGPSHWKWAVWLSAEEETLNEVEAVEYQLHSTFARPNVQITDRSSSFRLKGSGWGGFVIRARVDMRNGTRHNLRHRLQLVDEMQEKGDQPTLAICYAAGDGPLANKLANNLIKHGVSVRALDGGFVPREQFSLMDGIVVMVPSRLTSWMEIGFSTLVGTEIPTFVLMSKDNAKADNLSQAVSEIATREDITFLNYNPSADLDGVAGSILQGFSGGGFSATLS